MDSQCPGIQAFLLEMIDSISSTDQDQNRANIKIIAKNIHKRLVEQLETKKKLRLAAQKHRRHSLPSGDTISLARVRPSSAKNLARRQTATRSTAETEESKGPVESQPSLKRSNFKTKKQLHEDIDDLPTCAQIEEELIQLTEALNDPNLTDEEKVARRSLLKEKALNVGLMATDVAEAGIISAHVVDKGMKTFKASKTFSATAGSAWVFQGLILTAKTGVDYRALKNGEISQS